MPGTCEHPVGEKWTALYEKLLEQGHTEESAAKIANSVFTDSGKRSDAEAKAILSNRWKLPISRQ